MARVALLRVSAIRPVCCFLRASGVPLDRLLERLHLPVETFADPEAMIPTYLGTRFIGEAARREGAPTLGALVGEATRLEQLGLFGRRLLASATLYDLIRTARRLLPSFHSGERLWWGRVGPTLVLWHRFTVPLDDWCQQSPQYSLLIILALLRAVAGPRWRPTVYVEQGLPHTLRDVSLLRDAELILDQPACGVAVPPALLCAPLAALNPAAPVGDDLTAWNDARPAVDFPTSLRQWLTRIIGRDAVRIDILSETIGMTPRTLQRRLAEAGTTYRQVLARARFDLATRLLVRDDMPIREVAHAVGYPDPAHLTRAFLRWSGTTPSSFRRERRTDELR